MKKNVYKFLLTTLCAFSSLMLKADNSTDLLAGWRQLSLDSKIPVESKKAIYAIIAPQLNENDLKATKLAAKSLFFGKGAEAQGKLDEYIATLIPQDPAGYVKKFKDTLRDNGQKILKSAKGAKIGNANISDVQYKEMTDAAAEFARAA